MTRVLKMAPVRIASDPSSGVIAHWKHDALHDVVAPMADHVLVTFPSGSLRFERRTGKSVVFGTARPDTVTVIPSARRRDCDIPDSLNVIHFYLPQRTLERVALEAGTASPGDLMDRSAHPAPVTPLPRRSGSRPEKPRAIDGGACVNSNLSTGTAIALGHSQVWSAR
jgi:AraC family transcriptional regulator